MKNIAPWIRNLAVFCVGVLLGTPLVPAQAAPARSTAPLPGKWNGTLTRTLDVSDCKVDPCIAGHADYNSTVNFTVGADGAISTGAFQMDVIVTVSAPALPGVTTACQTTAKMSVTGGKASQDTGGLPTFELELSPQNVPTIKCSGGGSLPGEAKSKYKLTLTATAFNGNTATGEKLAFDPEMFEFGIQMLNKVGMTTKAAESWQLTNISPFFTGLTATYQQYFLQGIPLDNTYHAALDWNGNKPGTVTFKLGDQTKTINNAGTEVEETLELGGLPEGHTPMEVSAVSGGGEPAIPQSIDAILVPLKPWARAANFAVSERKAEGGPGYVIYAGKAFLPNQPLKLPYLEIPSGIPMVGGKWGVPPIQFTLNLLATSAGGKSAQAPVEGKVALYLGKDDAEFEATVGGHTTTNLSETALTLDQSQAEITLTPVKLEKSVGLLDLIPQLSAISKVPILGDISDILNGLFNLKGTLNVSVKGTGDIGVNDAGDGFKFTGGTITPAVEALIKLSTSFFKLLNAWVGGGGSGDFTLRVAPDPKWENCHLNLKFGAGLQVADVYDQTFEKEWPVYTCNPSAFAGGAGVAAMLPTRTLTGLTLSAPVQLVLPEQTVVESRQADGFEQTVLVKGAKPQTLPALAIGPAGQLAFAWVGEDPQAPGSPQVRLRLFDGQTWAEAVSVSTGANLNLSPSVAFDRFGRVLVAWVQNKAVNAGSQAQLDTAFAHGLEIYYAVVDPASGKVLRSMAFTNDQQMDFDPQLARGQDGTVWLGWVHSPGDTLAGNAAHPNAIYTARWDGTRWSAAETTPQALVGTLTWRLAAGSNQQALIVADIDTDGKLNTVNDRALLVDEYTQGKWAAPLTLALGTTPALAPLAAYNASGKPVLGWYRDGQLWGVMGDLQAQPQLWLDKASNLLLNGVLAAGAKDELAIVWPDPAQAQGIGYLHFDAASQTWSQPQILFGQGQTYASLAAGIDAQGGFVLGAAALADASQTITDTTGQTYTVPAQPKTADLLVARKPSQFAPVEIKAEPTQPLAPAAPPAGSGLDSPLTRVGLGVVCCAGLILVAGVAGAGGVWAYRRRAQPGQRK